MAAGKVFSLKEKLLTKKRFTPRRGPYESRKRHRTYMNDLAKQLVQWFEARPQWLQEAARRWLANGAFEEKDIKELEALCKREAGIVVSGFEQLKADRLDEQSLGGSRQKVDLRLASIGEISGINALSPKNPLSFRTEPLTIVYGPNGAGKSGYTRILKRCAGARGVSSLHADVFQAVETKQQCKISYTLDGKEHDMTWTPDIGRHDHLRHLCLYDTAAANVYVNAENEVTYEPAILACFRALVEICEKINESFNREIGANPSKKPLLPVEYSATPTGIWFNNLKVSAEKEVSTNCAWTEADEQRLIEVAARLQEPNPAEKAKALRKTKAQVTAMRSLLEQAAALLTDESFAMFLSAKGDATAKRKAADIDAKKVFEGASLDGVGTASWKLLWEQARAFSVSKAYPEATFPNIEDGSVCVLCLQTLHKEAKDRLAAFESFVVGKLETEAKTAEASLIKRVEALQKPTVEGKLEDKLDLCGIAVKEEREKVAAYVKSLDDRRSSFLLAEALADVKSLPNNDVLVAWRSLETKLEEQAKAFDEDAINNKRVEHERAIVSLKAQKWVSEQTGAIASEIERLKRVALLEKAQGLTTTKALSTKKSNLAEELITKAFVTRFEKELEALGASRVKVTIEKSRGTKGQVLHEVRLVGNKTGARVIDILSEGEFRIVSLAAFLADVDAEESTAAFIFDDPISSLDQDFEEATAARLIRLCGSRQVIVFTHRLSLLAMLEGAAEKADVQFRVVSLQREAWGTGEPSGPPLPAQKPKAALNSLSGERFAKARKVHEEHGSGAYAVEAKALCSDIRITIERLIESELMADVVQRFRRSINTLGKMDKLARIKLGDCKFLDEMMTKYSRYEHAQPREAPVAPPEPDEIEKDLKRLKEWQTEFSGRAIV